MGARGGGQAVYVLKVCGCAIDGGGGGCGRGRGRVDHSALASNRRARAQAIKLQAVCRNGPRSGGATTQRRRRQQRPFHSTARDWLGWLGLAGWLTRPPLVAVPPAAKAGAPARNLSLVSTVVYE